jgi:hypothetical protein
MNVTQTAPRRPVPPADTRVDAEERQRLTRTVAACLLLAGVVPGQWRQGVADSPVGLEIADAMDAVLAERLADGAR